MTKIEFIARYMPIEQRLHSMLPNFNAKDGMRALLDLLKNDNKISNVLFNDMLKILELRNRLVGEHNTDTPVPEQLADKIIAIKDIMHIWENTDTNAQ